MKRLLVVGCSLLAGATWAASGAADRRKVLEEFENQRDFMEWRVKNGIELNRKGECRLRFVRDNKDPGKVRVRIQQKSHAFKYGANLFMLDELPKPGQNAIYKQYFKEAFNLATLPFYWCDLEPEQGKPRYAEDSPKLYRRPAPDLCLNWCETNNIMPKAHCLNYAPYTPSWAKGGDVSTEKRFLADHFRELAERYAGRIRDWEVTNETLFGGNEKSPLFYDAPDFVEWSFKTAGLFFPGNRLIINDAHCNIWQGANFNYARSPYYIQIERALLKGARIDSIGLQFHMFYRREKEYEATRGFYDPRHIYEVLDTYAALGRPLQITELTIPAYSYDPADEAIQAEILRNLYRIWFSHPAVEAIIYWNLVDGFAAFAPQGDMKAGENYYHGGLIRYDFTPKPVFQVVKDMFGKEFRTSLEAESIKRGARQEVSFIGFYGDYDITVTLPDGTVKTVTITHSKQHHRPTVVEL